MTPSPARLFAACAGACAAIVLTVALVPPDTTEAAVAPVRASTARWHREPAGAPLPLTLADELDQAITRHHDEQVASFYAQAAAAEAARLEEERVAAEKAAAARHRAQPSTTTAAPAKRSTSSTYSGGGSGDPNNIASWDRLAQCESGGNWSINTGNGYSGGLQFALSSWRAVGGQGYPYQASREEQIRRGQMLYARGGGWGQWPACTRSFGWR